MHVCVCVCVCMFVCVCMHVSVCFRVCSVCKRWAWVCIVLTIAMAEYEYVYEYLPIYIRTYVHGYMCIIHTVHMVCGVFLSDLHWFTPTSLTFNPIPSIPPSRQSPVPPSRTLTSPRSAVRSRLIPPLVRSS